MIYDENCFASKKVFELFITRGCDRLAVTPTRNINGFSLFKCVRTPVGQYENRLISLAFEIEY